MTTTLDEISVRLGELTAYTHEHRHAAANLSMKFDALSLDLARRVEALDARLTTRIAEMTGTLSQRIDALDARIALLEADKHQREGVQGAIAWLVRNWLSLGTFIIVVAAVLRAGGKV